MAGALIRRLATIAPEPVLRRVELLAHRSPRARAALARLSRPMRHGAQPIASGPAKGLLIDVAGSRPSYILGTAEPEFVALLAEHVEPGDTVFDLGANVGYFTLICAALVGPSGRVVAFEPSPMTAEALRRNIDLNALNQVEVVEAAMSDREGTADLWLAKDDQSPSLVTSQGRSMVEVRTVSLRNEIARAGVPAVIKSDVEGAEFDVFTAAIGPLRLVRIVLCETHGVQGREHVDLADTLTRQGFHVRWLSRGDWTPQLVAVRH